MPPFTCHSDRRPSGKSGGTAKVRGREPESARNFGKSLQQVLLRRHCGRRGRGPGPCASDETDGVIGGLRMWRAGAGSGVRIQSAPFPLEGSSASILPLISARSDRHGLTPPCKKTEPAPQERTLMVVRDEMPVTFWRSSIARNAFARPTMNSGQSVVSPLGNRRHSCELTLPIRAHCQERALI